MPLSNQRVCNLVEYHLLCITWGIEKRCIQHDPLKRVLALPKIIRAARITRRFNGKHFAVHRNRKSPARQPLLVEHLPRHSRNLSALSRERFGCRSLLWCESIPVSFVSCSL